MIDYLFFRLSVPENAPFTAVLKFAAEEVSVCVCVCVLVCVFVFIVHCFLYKQFKVPPATSAIITNG